MSLWGKSSQNQPRKVGEDDSSRRTELRFQSLLEGKPSSQVAGDPELLRTFRVNVGRLVMRSSDGFPQEDKFHVITSIFEEFESYCHAAEAAVKEERGSWRTAVSSLFTELLTAIGIPASAPEAKELAEQATSLTSPADVKGWRNKVEKLLHPPGGKRRLQTITAQLRAADLSTANDNAAGLLGGGSAVEHLRKMMESGATGYIALFQLRCLEVIHQRFGEEAVHDCLMEVSAFLTHGLNRNDAIFHWSDSTLLAILQDKRSEMLVAAELQRVIDRNRESFVHIGGHTVMLRIPLVFELTAINRLSKAEDLLTISINMRGN
jgi:hypothetical protein